MRIWLNRSEEVPLREQLITQVIVGIRTREILPGERLPSTRELARRFGIRPPQLRSPLAWRKENTSNKYVY